MAYDLTFTAGLDGKYFKAGLDGLRDQAAKTSRRIGDIIKLGALKEGLGRAFRFVGEGIEKYAATNSLAASAVERHKAAVDSLAMGIGRDLTAGLISGSDGLGTFVRHLESARSATVNWLADMAGGDSAAVDAVMAQNQAMDAQGKIIAENLKKLRAMREQQMSEAPGMIRKLTEDARMAALDAHDPLEGAVEKADRAQADAIDQLREATSQLTSEEKQRLGVEEAIHTLMMAGVAVRGKAVSDAQEARAKKAQELADAEAAHQQARQSVITAATENQIGLMRLNGLDDQAAKMEVQLNYARQLQAIEKDINLTAAERAQAAAFIADQERQTLDAMTSQRKGGGLTNFRTLAPGQGGSAGLVQGVLGGAATRGAFEVATKPVVGEIQQVRRVLERIEKQSSVAVLG